MKEIFYKEVEEGEAVRWWLGFAYRHYHKRSVVAVLMPFNHIVRWLRELHWQLRKYRKSATDVLIERYEKGYADGEETSKRYYEEKLEEMNAKWNRVVGLAILAEREKLPLTQEE